jgi:hypothetical protein
VRVEQFERAGTQPERALGGRHWVTV